MASAMSNQTPAAIRLNYGMQRVRGGGNAVRAVACLPALIGAWKHPAGGLLLSSSGMFPVDKAALQRPDLEKTCSTRTINMVTIGDDLQKPSSTEFGPKIEALIVYNSNPVAVAPDSSQVVKGFAREDLFTVVLEHFQTDTADYADYILPATTQLEHWDIHTTYGHTDVMLNRPAIAPVGESKTNTQIFRELAAPHGLYRCLLCMMTTKPLCKQAFGNKVSFDTLLGERLFDAAYCRCAFRQRQLSHTVGQMRIFQRQLGQAGLGWFAGSFGQL